MQGIAHKGEGAENGRRGAGSGSTGRGRSTGAGKLARGERAGGRSREGARNTRERGRFEARCRDRQNWAGRGSRAQIVAGQKKFKRAVGQDDVSVGREGGWQGGSGRPCHALLGSAGPLVGPDVAETRAERVNDEVTPASSRAKKNERAVDNDKITPCI